MSEKGERRPIDRPCSACSAGDTKMEYHLHQPPFREMNEKDAEILDSLTNGEWSRWSPDAAQAIRNLRSELAAAQKEVTDAYDTIFYLVPEAHGEDGKELSVADKITILGRHFTAAQKAVERLAQSYEPFRKELEEVAERAEASEQREQTMRELLQRPLGILHWIEAKWSDIDRAGIYDRYPARANAKEIREALHTEEPHSVSIGVICARWKKLSDGCVARCDKAAGHEGDHVDGVIDIQWHTEEPQ